MHPSESDKLFLVVNKFLPREAGEGIVLQQEDRFLRTHLLAIAAKNAAKHVDLKFLWRFFHIARFRRASGSGGRNANRLGWTNKFAQLAGDTFDAPILI